MTAQSVCPLRHRTGRSSQAETTRVLTTARTRIRLFTNGKPAIQICDTRSARLGTRVHLLVTSFVDACGVPRVLLRIQPVHTKIMRWQADDCSRREQLRGLENSTTSAMKSFQNSHVLHCHEWKFTSISERDAAAGPPLPDAYCERNAEAKSLT